MIVLLKVLDEIFDEKQRFAKGDDHVDYVDPRVGLSAEQLRGL